MNTVMYLTQVKCISTSHAVSPDTVTNTVLFQYAVNNGSHNSVKIDALGLQ